MPTFTRMDWIIIRAGLYALQSGSHNTEAAKKRLEELIGKTYDAEVIPDA